MTQGIFIEGRRPKSKKEVREFVSQSYEVGTPHPNQREVLRIEATSVFGNEFDGPLSELPTNETITFVGPDPYTSRKFYGNIKYNQKKERWIVT